MSRTKEVLYWIIIAAVVVVAAYLKTWADRAYIRSIVNEARQCNP
jgi:hypothetical protein